MNKENIKTLVDNIYNTILSIDGEFKWTVISVPVNTWYVSYTARELHEEVMKTPTTVFIERFINLTEKYLENKDENFNIARKLLNGLKSKVF